MEILSTAKISVPILKARVKGRADFKTDWFQAAETEWFTLKFTAVEMSFSDDVKPRIIERLCDFKIKTIKKFQNSFFKVTNNSRNNCDNSWSLFVMQELGQVSEYSD